MTAARPRYNPKPKHQRGPSARQSPERKRGEDSSQNLKRQRGPTSNRSAARAEARGSSWNPNIIVFACNWCSYAGADTAGVSRIQHQPHFRVIRVMCSGRIQPGFVLRAFEKGADGVLVSGCHFGDCHYVFGNERAVEQFEKTKSVIRLLGLEEGRLRLEWISAAEGARFAEVINEFTDQVRALGPSPLNQKQVVSPQSSVVSEAVAGEPTEDRSLKTDN
jgi:F420-non-reducing hydrogenase iron-sulfur subunit